MAKKFTFIQSMWFDFGGDPCEELFGWPWLECSNSTPPRVTALYVYITNTTMKYMYTSYGFCVIYAMFLLYILCFRFLARYSLDAELPVFSQMKALETMYFPSLYSCSYISRTCILSLSELFTLEQ